jgi:hypothetical protein
MMILCEVAGIPDPEKPDTGDEDADETTYQDRLNRRIYNRLVPPLCDDEEDTNDSLRAERAGLENALYEEQEKARKLRDAMGFAVYWIPRNGTEAMHKLNDALGQPRQPGFAPTMLQVENGKLRAEVAELRKVAESAGNHIRRVQGIGITGSPGYGIYHDCTAVLERIGAALTACDPAHQLADDDPCAECGKTRSQHEGRPGDHDFDLFTSDD